VVAMLTTYSTLSNLSTPFGEKRIGSSGKSQISIHGIGRRRRRPGLS
jgi:hypothetical protein